MTALDSSYRFPVRVLHWAMALLILAMIATGFAMVQEELPQSVRNTLFIFHKNTGILAFSLVLLRLILRLVFTPPPLPDTVSPVQQKAAAASHALLYVLMFAMPVLGYIRVKAGGFPIESLDAWGVPVIVPRSDDLANTAKFAHFVGAIAISAVVALHLSAAIFHALVLKDGVFARMWFGKSRA
ncbi:MAG: cytochrome b [Dinoroseobacter sp.]|nr:cytochrome b [Dinoroseobacter sp.]